jgi:Uma2 family endonuclease
MKANPLPKMSPEEYLEFERRADEKHEYRDGVIVAMSGARRAHNIISTNINGLLWQHLRNRDCESYSNDMRVFLPIDNIYAYPDIAVVCGKPEFQDQVFDTLLNPVVLFEILSDSTEGYDRGDKFRSYRKISSLREYILVSQYRRQVEKYTRHGDGFWMLTDAAGPDSAITLESIDCTLTLAEIYDKVDFEGGEGPVVHP